MKVLFVVDVGVDLPGRQPSAVAVRQGERVHQNVIQFVEQAFREAFRPARVHRLQADADGILA
jgi:hypothetical protein